MSEQQSWLNRGQKVLIQNYNRMPFVMARGEGCFVWDSDGRRYLDLFAGFGGGILGHCHPELVEAASAQAKVLWHVGNVYYNQPQIEFAETLNRTAFEGQAFFCQSGAEADEAACKIARYRGNQRSPKRWKIVSLHKSFHGRTLAMLAATGNPKPRAGFEPDVPGFINVEPGNFEALLKAVDDEVCGIILEPIQGEGGVNLYPPDYLPKVRELCDRLDLTLIFDEVWTGCGRTGKWFGHQHFGVLPDVMTLGKAVGGGLPVGVMFARPHIAKVWGPGTHGSTLGGNGIGMAVAKRIFDIIDRDGLLAHAASLGQYAVGRLQGEAKIKDKIAEVRGKGLMLGIDLKEPPAGLVERAMERGVIVNLTANKVIRLAPPVNIDKGLWEQGLDAVVELIAG